MLVSQTQFPHSEVACMKETQCPICEGPNRSARAVCQDCQRLFAKHWLEHSRFNSTGEESRMREPKKRQPRQPRRQARQAVDWKAPESAEDCLWPEEESTIQEAKPEPTTQPREAHTPRRRFEPSEKDLAEYRDMLAAGCFGHSENQGTKPRLTVLWPSVGTTGRIRRTHHGSSKREK